MLVDLRYLCLLRGSVASKELCRNCVGRMDRGNENRGRKYTASSSSRDKGRDTVGDRDYQRVSDAVWKTLKRTLVLEEEEADMRSFLEDDVETFHTPPESPDAIGEADDSRLLDPILSKSDASQRHYTPTRAQRMLYLHDTIVRDLTRPEASRIPAIGVEAARRESRRKLTMTYIPSGDGSPGRTVKYDREGNKSEASPSPGKFHRTASPIGPL